MNNIEESSKSHLGEIKQAISKITALRARAIYLRKISQENHVKRMRSARSRGETLSSVFILPTNSPHREPNCSQNDLPTLFKSPNKTAIKEDKQVKDNHFRKCKVMNQSKEISPKAKASDYLKTLPETEDDKKVAMIYEPKDSKKSTVKSPLSVGKFKKREKLNHKEKEQKPYVNKVHKDKTANKNSKKISIFYSESPSTLRNLDKKDGDTCAIICDDVTNSPKQVSPVLEKSHQVHSVLEKSPENSPEKAESVHEISYSSNTFDAVGTKLKEDPKNKIVHASEINHPLKRATKKKNKGLSRHKANTLKSAQNKEKKIRESKNKIHITNANKISRTKKVNPNMTLKTIAKKDPSLLSHSMSLDSLEDLRKTQKQKVSPVPRTIDKVRNFINDKSDLMTSTSLESYHQTDKKLKNPDKHILKPYGPANGSKIPVHEFRTLQTKKHAKDKEMLEELPQYKFRTKDKEASTDEYNEDTSDTLPLLNPFKNKKCIVKSWLKSVPDVTQSVEKTGKKARECVPSSLSFITESSISETGKQPFFKNDAGDFSEIGKETSPSPKNLRCTTVNKSPEVEELYNNNANSSEVLISLPSATALSESEEARKRFLAIKNNLGPIIRDPDFKFSKNSKEFLINPIEKFMNQINLAMNQSDSEEGIDGSSRVSEPKPTRKIKSERQPLKWKR